MISRCKVGWNLGKQDHIIFSGITHEVLGKLTPLDKDLFKIKNFAYKDLVNDDTLYKIAEAEYPIPCSTESEKKNY